MGIWLDVFVLSVLGALLIGTVLFDAGARLQWLRVLHGWGLVPQWSFFAPTPGTQNLYLLYRDVQENGDVTAWRIVHDMDSDRGPWTFIWNPRRRLRKALHDLICGLPYGEYQARPDLFKLSTPYLLILHHLASMPRLRGTRATEFLIMESRPHEPPVVAFQSELHRL